MTDKEFRRLSRSDLLSIIYEYQKQQEELSGEIEELKNEIEELKERLGEKQLRINNAGSIAEAVAGLTGIFETAQKTADEYVEQIRIAAETEKKEIITAAQNEAKKIIKRAGNKAARKKNDQNGRTEGK